MPPIMMSQDLHDVAFQKEWQSMSSSIIVERDICYKLLLHLRILSGRGSHRECVASSFDFHISSNFILVLPNDKETDDSFQGRVP